MKKVILLTACTVAVLLSGCSDNELASVGDGIGTSTQSAIGFHVVGNQAETRATPITPSNITTTDFNVYAYIKNAEGNDGSPFMGGNDSEFNQKNGINISYKSGNWSYTNPSDIRYWPTTDTELNFYAVNPGSAQFFSWKFTNSEKEISYNCFNEYQTSNFTIENGVNKPIHTNTDVMYAVAKDQTHETNNGIVKFNFKHILSQVVFKAKTQYDNDMEVDINAVSIHNFKTGGIFKIPVGEPEQGDWTLNSINQASGFTVKKVETGKNIKVSQSNNAADISDGPMLFVPQKLTKWDVSSTIATAKQSYLMITCKIKQGGAYLFGSDSEYKDLYVPFEADWQPGKRYIYTLIFGGGYDADGNPILQPINFEAKAEDWANEPESNVNL